MLLISIMPLYIICLVLMVEFSSKAFNGSESSLEVILNIVVVGGTATKGFDVCIHLYGASAEGNAGYFSTVQYLSQIIGQKDFISTPETVRIPAKATSTTMKVPVINDTIVEGNEIFNASMSLKHVPSSHQGSIKVGSITRVNGIILDSSSKLKTFILIKISLQLL